MKYMDDIFKTMSYEACVKYAILIKEVPPTLITMLIFKNSSNKS